MDNIERDYFCEHRVGGQNPLCLLNYNPLKKDKGIAQCPYKLNSLTIEGKRITSPCDSLKPASHITLSELEEELKFNPAIALEI